MGGDYYVHVKDNDGNIGISSKATIALAPPLSEYIIDNSISGLDKNLIGTDTLYRFSGTSGNTGINNYICLGTSTKCSSGSDNMYRIIGVEPDTGYVKVIKQIKYGSNIVWNSSTGVTWPSSSSYNTMLTWYNSVSFKSMIVSHSWNIGDFTSAPSTRSIALSIDTGNTTTAFVGMLALSDYYLAYKGEQNWSSSYSNYTSNWIHLVNNGTSDYEWTMSRYNSNLAWSVFSNGAVTGHNMNMNSNAVRPVFYLNSTVNRISGSGTIDDPFIVNIDVALSSTINNNNSTSATITFTSNKAGTYCVNTSNTVNDMNNCKFSGSISENASITTGVIATDGTYYAHVLTSNGLYGISDALVVTTCFTEETLVMYWDRKKKKKLKKKIKEIKEGDIVYTYNAETGRIVTTKVKKVHINKANKLFKFTFDDGNYVEVSENHPFYVKNIGYMNSQVIKEGYEIVCADCDVRRIISVEEINLDKEVDLYSLEVDEGNNFVVSGAKVIAAAIFAETMMVKKVFAGVGGTAG